MVAPVSTSTAPGPARPQEASPGSGRKQRRTAERTKVLAGLAACLLTGLSPWACGKDREADSRAGTRSAPRSPESFAATVVQGESVLLTWLDVSDSETGFVVERLANGTTYGALAFLPPESTSYLDATTQPGRTYAYRVAAVNGILRSVPVELSLTVPAGPASLPLLLEASALAWDQVRLSWAGGAREGEIYLVEKGAKTGTWGLLSELGSSYHGYVDTGLDPATPYTYRLRIRSGSFVSEPAPEVRAVTPWRIDRHPGYTEGAFFTDFVIDPHMDLYVVSYDKRNLDLVLRTTAVNGRDWTRLGLDSTGDVGSYASTALDNNGRLHVAYYDASNGDLRYLSVDTRILYTSVPQREVVDLAGDVGSYTSIAVDAAGHAHISYYDSTNADLKYATNASGAWATQTLDSEGDAGRYSSIAIDPQGGVHIAYQKLQGWGWIGYATNASGSWVTRDLLRDASVILGYYASLALDPVGKVHVAYYFLSNGPEVDQFDGLEHLTQTAGTWQRETVDEALDPGHFASLAIDRGGRIHLAYYEKTLQQVKYAVKESDRWELTTVDTVEADGGYTSLALDPRDRPWISYRGLRDLSTATTAPSDWKNR
ncbi:MAG: hypothetical protein HYY13_11760 [Nitrospirae bacterium]|nr:hypothetical protein [Nitrospirota bacterium]